MLHGNDLRALACVVLYYSVGHVFRHHHKPTKGHTMSNINTSLAKVATIHGVDMTHQVDAITGDAFTTLASFKARNDAIRAGRRALKDGDTVTADDFAIRAESMKDDNRSDCRAMLKASVGMTRRERALIVTLAAKGV